MELNLNYDQLISLSPQMLQPIEIMKMDAQQLREFLNLRCEENPVIELVDDETAFEALEDDDFDDLDEYDYLDSAEEPSRQVKKASLANLYSRSEATIHSHLMLQLNDLHLSSNMQNLCTYIIMNIDENGYLTESISTLSKRIETPERKLCEALNIVQSIAPNGVGAQNISDRLLLQLRQKSNSKLIQVAQVVVENYFDLFLQNRYLSIARKLHLDTNVIEEACAIIKKLNLSPCCEVDSSIMYAIPDIVVLNIGARNYIYLNGIKFPQITIDTYYLNLYKTTQDYALKKYLRREIDNAKKLISFLDLRKHTLISCVEQIVQLQKDYFTGEKSTPRAMTLMDVAKNLDIPLLNVSSVIQGKYLQHNFGICPISSLFSSAADGSAKVGAVSRTDAKSLLLKILDEEDPAAPLSDQQIVERMEACGITLARRTVAKFRGELSIPPAYMRKTV